MEIEFVDDEDGETIIYLSRGEPMPTLGPGVVATWSEWDAESGEQRVWLGRSPNARRYGESAAPGWSREAGVGSPPLGTKVGELFARHALALLLALGLALGAPAMADDARDEGRCDGTPPTAPRARCRTECDAGVASGTARTGASGRPCAGQSSRRSRRTRSLDC